jgi:hypothetical protein
MESGEDQSVAPAAFAQDRLVLTSPGWPEVLDWPAEDGTRLMINFAPVPFFK